MKRPVEFWAAVVLALVVVYMIHDAYGSRYNTAIHIEEIDVRMHGSPREYIGNSHRPACSIRVIGPA